MQTDDCSHVEVVNPLVCQAEHFGLQVFNSAADHFTVLCVTHLDKAQFGSLESYSTSDFGVER